MRFITGRRSIRNIISILLLILAGCSSPTREQTPASSPVSTIQSPTGTSASTATPASIDGPSYDNPVYNRDFPDPFILRVDDIYYGYSTSTSTANIPAIRSEDLANWEWIGEVLPALPGWVDLSEPRVWAPGVIQINDTFVLYYTAHDEESNRQCISRAVSSSPEGLFVDDSIEPFICQVEQGGSIDPYPFTDAGGQMYIFWKNDGNCCGKEVALWGQGLSEDGLSLEGEPVKLIVRDQPWERPLVENPAMVLDGDRYYLFYSANRWEGHEYAIGYAVCETVTGPCMKPLDEPLFKFTTSVMGPGGESFFSEVDGDLWMAYHAWTAPVVGYPAGKRSLHIEPVEFVDGMPVIEGPTHEPQPIP